MSLREKAKTAGPPILTLPLRDIRLSQFTLVVRLGDFRLEPPSRGLPSGSSVSGTSVWNLRLSDLRLEPPSQGHPSGTSVRGHPSGTSVSGTSVWNLLLRDICLELPSGDIGLGPQIQSKKVILISSHRTIEPNAKRSLIVTQHLTKR